MADGTAVQQRFGEPSVCAGAGRGRGVEADGRVGGCSLRRSLDYNAMRLASSSSS